MQKQQAQTHKKTLLVFNCHEAWVYQLRVLGYNLDIITGLEGRYKENWDEQMRPVPPNSRLVSLSQAHSTETPYYCIIAYSITDLLDVKHLSGPRLIVIHSTLERRVVEEKSNIAPEKMRAALHQYLQLIGGHAVAVSALKGKSWGITGGPQTRKMAFGEPPDDIVPFGVDADDYLPYSGEKCSGLRICNFVENRWKIFLWDFYETAFNGIPVQLVGHDPNIPEAKAAQSWEQLKKILQSHRFYIHTADPIYEDGYNMATLEAMAAGLPVLGNRHFNSPVEHGVSGFLSDDAEELGKYARMLLADRNLAVRMGQEARKAVIERFSMDKLKKAFLQSIETARVKYQSQVDTIPASQQS